MERPHLPASVIFVKGLQCERLFAAARKEKFTENRSGDVKWSLGPFLIGVRAVESGAAHSERGVDAVNFDSEHNLHFFLKIRKVKIMARKGRKDQ